jgi:hypothetical protein
VSTTALDDATRRDIDDRVARILRDLGNPSPPLPLDDVRELLRLDRAFYTAEDPVVLAETVHRLKVAGQQILRRSARLVDVVRRAVEIMDRPAFALISQHPRHPIPPTSRRCGITSGREISPGSFAGSRATISSRG